MKIKGVFLLLALGFCCVLTWESVSVIYTFSNEIILGRFISWGDFTKAFIASALLMPLWHAFALIRIFATELLAEQTKARRPNLRLVVSNK